MPGEGEDDFKNRVQEYLQKALREAKTILTGRRQMKNMKVLLKILQLNY